MKILTAIDINHDEYPVSEKELIWRPSVYGIVVNDGKILLSPQHGIGYDLPGGGMEFGETFEYTAIREVKEETGIDVAIKQLIDVHTSLFVWEPNNPSKRESMQSIMLFYLCEKTGGELSTDGLMEDEMEYAELAEWVDISHLDTLKFSSSVNLLPFIKKALEIYRGN